MDIFHSLARNSIHEMKGYTNIDADIESNIHREDGLLERMNVKHRAVEYCPGV
jgi:hypothetical protein